MVQRLVLHANGIADHKLTFMNNDGAYTFSKMGYDDMFSGSLTKGALVSAFYVQTICSILALKAQNAKVKFACYNAPHFTPNSTLFENIILFTSGLQIML